MIINYTGDRQSLRDDAGLCAEEDVVAGAGAPAGEAQAGGQHGANRDANSAQGLCISLDGIPLGQRLHEQNVIFYLVQRSEFTQTLTE